MVSRARDRRVLLDERGSARFERPSRPSRFRLSARAREHTPQAQRRLRYNNQRKRSRADEKELVCCRDGRLRDEVPFQEVLRTTWCHPSEGRVRLNNKHST